MLKNVAQLEHVVGGKIFHFTCDQDSPLPHIKDALNKFIQYVGQIEDNIAAQQKAAQEKADAEKAEVQPEVDIKPE